MWHFYCIIRIPQVAMILITRKDSDCMFYLLERRTAGNGGAVVTYLPPTSEVGGSNPGPYVGKLVVAY